LHVDTLAEQFRNVIVAAEDLQAMVALTASVLRE